VETTRRPHVTGRLRLAFACVSIVLAGAAAGCDGSSAAPRPGADSPAGSQSAGGQPATAQSGAARGWGPATHLDSSRGSEDPASVSCPSASFCMAVLGSGYAARYDGTTWSRPARLSSSGGEPDSVSCPTVSFCMAVDARDSSTFAFDGSTWSPAPSVPGTQMGTHRCRARHRAFVPPLATAPARSRSTGPPGAPATAIDPGNELSTVSCPSARFCAAVDGGGGNVITFDGSSWTAPVNVDSRAARSVSGPVLIFLMSVSCISAVFCVAGDSIGDAFVRS
jgi:hypothetical protein